MSIRNFKMWNEVKTSSFDLSQPGITVVSPQGLGNKFNNQIQTGNRSRKYLINQKNDFDNISFKVLFGLKSKNAYELYNQLAIFIQKNGRNQLIIEYSRNDVTLYADVSLKQITKSEKNEFNIIEETLTFERLTPFYSIKKYENISSVVVNNNYPENILPIIEIIGPTSGQTDIILSNVKHDDNYILGVEGFAQSNTLLTRTDAAAGLAYSLRNDGEYIYSTSNLDHLYPYSEIKEVKDKYGNLFMRIPKFYAKRTATSLKISKYKQDENWFDPFDGQEYIDIGKYKASESNSKMRSIPGVLPRVSINITNFRIACKNNGHEYGQSDIWSDWIISSLFYIMFATTNSQSVFSGRTTFDSATETGQTDYIPYQNGMHIGSGQFKLFGIEDLWGHVWEFIDGVNFLEEQIFICKDPKKYNSITITSDYEYYGDRPMTNGYVKSMAFNPNVKNFQFPNLLGAGSTSYYSDYYYQNTGQRIAFKGGDWSSGSYAGLSFWRSDVSASDAGSIRGGRLLRRPS